MRRCLQRRYEESAASGSLSATAVRAYLSCIKGHLAEMDDGQNWRPTIEMCLEMTNAVMKECRPLLTKAQGDWQAKHGAEERIDHPTRQNIEDCVLEALEEREGQPDTALSNKEKRSQAVWRQQAIHVALCVKQGHRTGVYQRMTVAEFEGGVCSEDGGVVVSHVGGSAVGRPADPNSRPLGMTDFLNDPSAQWAGHC